MEAEHPPVVNVRFASSGKFHDVPALCMIVSGAAFSVLSQVRGKCTAAKRVSIRVPTDKLCIVVLAQIPVPRPEVGHHIGRCPFV